MLYCLPYRATRPASFFRPCTPICRFFLNLMRSVNSVSRTNSSVNAPFFVALASLTCGKNFILMMCEGTWASCREGFLSGERFLKMKMYPHFRKSDVVCMGGELGSAEWYRRGFVCERPRCWWTNRPPQTSLPRRGASPAGENACPHNKTTESEADTARPPVPPPRI